MLLRLEKFIGIAPKLAESLLPENAATIASNCKTDSGALAPFNGMSAVAGVTLDGGAKSLYKKSSTGAWVSFTHDTNAVLSPIPNDAYDRVYWTDDDATTIPSVDSNETFTSPYWLGVPAPGDEAGSFSATQNGADGDDPLQAEIRAYVITYVSSFGEEGPPSAVTADDFVTVYPGNTVDLANIPLKPSTGTYNVAARNIYRTNTGSTTTEFQLVATLGNITATTYNDAIADADLGVVLPSENWDVPPTDMQGLCSHPAGFLVGFSGREVCCSELFLPHAWPTANKYPVDSDIVAVAIFGTTILVMTEKLPYYITGSDPAAMYVERPESGEACTNKRGVVDFGDVVVYPSARGLVAVGVGRPPALITKDILSDDNWATYLPATLEAYRLGNRYMGICSAGAAADGFVFDLSNGSFVTLSSVDVNAGYYDESEGELYLKLATGNTALYQWDDVDEDPLTFDWKSKQFVAPIPVNFGAAQVFADAYPVTMMVYADGVLKHTEAVASETPFRLPGGYLGTKWHIELTGTTNVNSALIATTMAELKRI